MLHSLDGQLYREKPSEESLLQAHDQFQALMEDKTVQKRLQPKAGKFTLCENSRNQNTQTSYREMSVPEYTRLKQERFSDMVTRSLNALPSTKTKSHFNSFN